MSEHKERPILFSGPMVKAILEGRKTQTRRLIRLPPGYEHGEVYGYEGCHGGLHALACDPGPSRAIRCPYGVPGDRLWVRETHGIATGHMYDGAAAVRYLSDGSIRSVVDDRSNASRRSLSTSKSRPSIHMPRWASRLTLEVTAVRVERLQDITEDDARAEGFEPVPVHGKWAGPRQTGGHWSARKPFVETWDSINGGIASWSDNPWVWVVNFKRAEVSHV